MISFTLSIIALIIGYFLYGRFVERVFGPDDRVTPAVSKADGLDYIVMPGWKIFMIQFLNIAGRPICGLSSAASSPEPSTTISRACSPYATRVPDCPR